MANVLNRKATKRHILKRCEKARPGWDCTSVSKQALDDIEAFIIMKINQSVHSHPSKGKTYKYFI